MSQPPPPQRQHPLPLSASPTPPSSLPPSPNPLQQPTLQRSSRLSASLADAILQQFTAKQYCDDGVDLVMDMLSNEKAVTAPLPPPDVDRLLASWRAAEWSDSQSPKPTVLNYPEGQTPLTTIPDATSEGSAHEEPEWIYFEDCVVADVFTSVRPEKQREALRKRLPKRSWSDAHRRFRTVCDQVCANGAEESDTRSSLKEWKKGFWRRRTNGNLKPQSLISKTLSKLR